MLLLLALFLLGNAARAEGPPSAEFQWKLVELFSSERCDLVRASTSAALYEKLKPNVRAIAAFCEPRDADPAALFASAERDDPTGDLILTLHAKWQWKRDREKARPLWDKVLKLARNPSLKAMAERYLNDDVEKDEILHLSALSWQAKAAAGGGYESNPTLPLEPQPREKHPQAFSSLALGGGAQRWVSFGSLSANYEGAYRRYLATPDLSQLTNLFEAPVSLRLGTYEDLVLRPFYGISFAGSREYATRFGLGVKGVAYRPDYKQSVQGSIFSERLFFPNVKPEEGTHYRFDYDWEFFPGSWVYRVRALMEHVHAINDFHNGTDLKFSHTDLGGAFRARYLSGSVIYEGEVQGKVRLDSLPSSYPSTTTGARLSDRRNDLVLTLRPAATIPLGRELFLELSYELDRTWSPMTYPGDYADYNIFDQKGELRLVTALSNY